MKKSILIIAIIFFTINIESVTAQNSCCSSGHTKQTPTDNNSDNNIKNNKGEKSVKFNVLGNCSMCKARIEKAALGVDGVKTAEWNNVTKSISISWKGNLDESTIEKAIASVGHDTKNYKADDKVYNTLPGCCKYDR